jgi:hypothetical protein
VWVLLAQSLQDSREDEGAQYWGWVRAIILFKVMVVAKGEQGLHAQYGKGSGNNTAIDIGKYFFAPMVIGVSFVYKTLA